MDDSLPHIAMNDHLEETSILEIITIVLNNRRMIIRLSVLCFVLIIGINILQPRSFSSSASFIPQSSGLSSSSLAGLAAQIGFSLPVETSDLSAAFYADYIASYNILKSLVQARYSVSGPSGTITGDLMDYYRIKNGSFDERSEIAIRRLRDSIAINMDRETSLVRFTVTSHWATLSQSIAHKLLECVHVFNADIRQSQAHAERIFIDGRLSEAKAELRISEDNLQDFLQNNRQYQNSPELEFIYNRLQREVFMRQEVVTSLSQSFEQARISEVRNTPVITIIEQPVIPVFPDRRYLKMKGLLAILCGGGLGIMIAFISIYFDGIRLHRDNMFDEYQTSKKAMLQDIRRPWRIFWLSKKN